MTLHIPTQTLALALTSALVTAWSLRAYPTAIGLGHASVIVNLLLLTETAVRSAVKPSAAFSTSSRDRQDRYTNPRDAPAFLVLDTVSLALVTLHSLQVCGFVHFADPRVALALVAAWPATIANWITRLALETTAFDSLARAVAVKEVAAMRLATQVRRLGGVRSVPPDANAFKRFLHWCACMWDSGKLMAESGSGRTFRRAMLACSCVDWVLLLGAWTAMGIQGAATHGGTWVNPAASAAVPLAMFLALDAIRLSCQLAHSKLLRRLRSRRLGGTSRGSSTRSFIRPPAGMTTGLTRWVFFANIACFISVAALGCTGGVWRAPVSVFTPVVSFLLLGRFHRLMIEGAYLAATLLAKVVDRSGGTLPVFVDVGGGARGDAGRVSGSSYASSISPRYLEPARNELYVSGNKSARGLLGSIRAGVANKMDAAGRSMDAFLTGVGRARVDQFGPPGVNADDSNSGLSLPEFTEAISTGLRGHLAGKGAEDAAKKLFDEMTSGDGDNAVGLTEIKEWLADQPPLDDNAMTGASSASNSGSVDDDDVTGDKWRVSVQRVLLQFVESRDRVTSAMTKTFEDIQGHVLPMMPAMSSPRPGLRLLSLEGGGIKGLTLIWQLRALERAAGKPIHELFDLIGGVSTGGIIALAIARGTPLDDLEEMYWDIARLVFGKQSAVRQLIKGHAGENDEIKRLLVEGLGDLPMITDDPGQRVKCFVVSTQQTDRLEVRLIRSYKNPNKGRDQNERWAQWEAGMATSSAPTVFPPFIRTDDATGDKSTFIDGALSGYNNPSSLVLNEGLDLAEPGQRIDVLLSLGCGEAKGSMGDNPFWIVGQVMNLAFDTELQEAHVASMIRRFSPQTSHVRVNPPTAHYSLTEHRVDVLTRMEDDTRAYLAETRPIFAELASRLTAHVGGDAEGNKESGKDNAFDDGDMGTHANNMVANLAAMGFSGGDLSKVPAAAAGMVDTGMASMRSWIDESFPTTPGKAR